MPSAGSGKPSIHSRQKRLGKTGEAPFNCRLMRIAPDLPILCLTQDASILGLHEGKWEVEFSAQ